MRESKLFYNLLHTSQFPFSSYEVLFSPAVSSKTVMGSSARQWVWLAGEVTMGSEVENNREASRCHCSVPRGAIKYHKVSKKGFVCASTSMFMH